MCLAQGPQRSDAGEARTRGPSVSCQALYHCAPKKIDMKAMISPLFIGLYSDKVFIQEYHDIKTCPIKTVKINIKGKHLEF